MIVIDGLTKRYGDTTAVDGLTFTVRPGRVTGLLGPTGAGKSATMRLILGLDRADAGTVTVNGRPYADAPRPMREVGALLDARAVHPRRTARDHLRWLARSNGVPAARVDEVLWTAGLASVARRRAGTFSLGMCRRLGVAAALLGDPGVLLLDEPVNGLDAEGAKWIRELMRDLAAQGRTVLVSSRLMSEMAQTADHLVVIARGRLIADAGMDEFAEGEAGIVVRADLPALLADRLRTVGGTCRPGPDGALIVTGVEPREIGEAALTTGVVLSELTPRRASLEQAYLDLTRDTLEFHAGSGKDAG
ncbi:ABC transporter ATP-binding protein [Bailinhaonella thermotolerans]|uniref:ATP-binding cassette domain-containing protein n=1 Tax=Bailinhaonella thermotolerans TaxID=1070861 RepID=A0A3A4BD35_9ACTN|nr:ATP-binding cassette domain-containing protein [Bailinhaonella thermotolerans]RJL32118.1 ATP-binding cassette domain-containing protein [Bailinhaonella thermotolerans]